MTLPLAAPALEGFLLGASLIIAIGAQNAFVLRQGLARRHVFAVAAFCTLSDAVLIVTGVAGLGTLVQQSPLVLTVVTLAGAAFLFTYGAMALRRALHPGGLSARGAAESRLGPALATIAALTFLNPHVYLDTVVLVGGISTTFAENRWFFALGAASASFIWFFALAYGARLLTPVFKRPAAWQVLDIGIGCVMWLLAAKILTTPL